MENKLIANDIVIFCILVQGMLSFEKRSKDGQFRHEVTNVGLCVPVDVFAKEAPVDDCLWCQIVPVLICNKPFLMIFTIEDVFRCVNRSKVTLEQLFCNLVVGDDIKKEHDHNEVVVSVGDPSFKDHLQACVLDRLVSKTSSGKESSTCQ